jgi:hypothetical protein
MICLPRRFSSVGGCRQDLALCRSELGAGRASADHDCGAPLALTAILVPFRLHFANTDVALALVILIVAGLRAGTETCRTREQLLLAVAFADQLGAALSAQVATA